MKGTHNNYAPKKIAGKNSNVAYNLESAVKKLEDVSSNIQNDEKRRFERRAIDLEDESYGGWWRKKTKT